MDRDDPRYRCAQLAKAAAAHIEEHPNVAGAPILYNTQPCEEIRVSLVVTCKEGIAVEGLDLSRVLADIRQQSGSRRTEMQTILGRDRDPCAVVLRWYF